jgi:tRNA(Ile)-lysidine synthase
LLVHTDLDTPLTALLAAPHWYVAFSGGLDSTVLLHLVHRWRADHPDAPALAAIHVNHGLQASAGDWQRHCEAQCREWQLPCLTRVVEVQPVGSTEAAARDARYRAFEEELPPGAVLFMAHHLDDQIETFFLRLLRGAGVDGLAGMPRQRALGSGQLVRPLLDYPRTELERYAAQHGLTFVADPSNHDTAIDRNFLRADVLPVLASRWPAYRQSVARAMGHVAAAAESLAASVGVPDTVHSVMGDPGLRVSHLLEPAQPIAAARLRAWLVAQGRRLPDHAALVEFLRQLREAAVDGGPRLDCGEYALRRFRDAVYLEPVDVTLVVGDLHLLPGERRVVSGVGTVSVLQGANGTLALLPGEQLTVRWRKGGERCRLPGRAGSRSLKTLLQEWQVPPWWRDRVPLLYLGDELLAVGDLAQCESSRWRAAVQPGELLWYLYWERPLRARSD